MCRGNLAERKVQLELTDDDLDRLVGEINRMTRLAGLRFAFEVGYFVFERIYGGSLTALQARGAKDQGLRRLARRPDLQLSASFLSRAVHLYRLCSLHRALLRTQHVTVSHFGEVQGLSTEEQAHLLMQADREKWSVRFLREQVRGRPSRRRGPGQSRPDILRIVRNAHRSVAHVDADPESGLTASDAKEALDLLRAIRSWCDNVEESLLSRERLLGDGPEGSHLTTGTSCEQ